MLRLAGMKVSADDFTELLETAREENKLCPKREHQLVSLPAQGEVWMTGDIHDHRTNLDKFIKAADLGNHPDRHVILHELIHGDHIDANGAEDSWISLYRAAQLKLDFPNQVHFLLANHDLAQVFGEGIMKGGLSVCEAFHQGLKRDFPERYHFIEAAISEFLLSMPLAIRTPNGLWFSHSLPRDSEIDSFDYGVFDRKLTGDDYKRRTGAAYQLIWGRGVSPEGAARFADRVKAKLIVTGHQPQEMGYAVNGDRHLIIASDHNQGVFLPLRLDHDYSMDDLVSRLKKFVAISFT